MDRFRPSRLWKQMSQERKLEAARAFWEDEQSLEQQVEAIAGIARQLNFRPKSVAALPVDKRARYLAGLQTVSDMLASRLLVAYHLTAQRPMMARFLDALGIAHEDGLITDEEITPPEKSKLEEGAGRLRQEFPAEDVDLYFATLIAQDPDTWGELAGEVSARP